MNSLNKQKLEELLENEKLREENNKLYYQKLSTLSVIVNNEFDKENGIKIIDDDTTLNEDEVLRQKKLQQYYETGTITNIKQMKNKNTYIAVCEEDQSLVDEMLEQVRTLETIYHNTGDKKVYREIKNVRGIILALCYIDNITTCNKYKSWI